MNTQTQMFNVIAPNGELINTADSERNAFKLLGAKSNKDREILIKAGFKVEIVALDEAQ